MRALRLQKHVAKHGASEENYEGCFAVDEIAVPKPASGEVLVRVSHSPINPSDLSTMQGTYNSAQRAELPCGLGFEASGVVVSSGGGFLANRLVGKRVACVTTGAGALYAQYAAVAAMNCIELPGDVSFAEGCSCFVNPLTVISFVEIARNTKHKTILHTAAASSLGKMLVPYAKSNGVKVICVVRRDQQREILAELGAEHIIVSSEEGWEDQLKAKCEELNCRLAFDAVAGGLTGTILHAMPRGSTVKVYGGLSEQHCSNISPSDLIFRQCKVEGFWLTGYMKTKNIIGIYSWTRTIAKLLKKSLSTSIRKTYTIDEASAALADYMGNMSLGKIAFTPNPEEQAADKKEAKEEEQKEEEEEPEKEEKEKEEKKEDHEEEENEEEASAEEPEQDEAEADGETAKEETA